MVLFDPQSRIRRFANECEIMEEYFPVRLQLYVKRKKYQLGVMRKDLKLMDNKCRFIEGVNRDQIKLRDQSKLQIVEQLSRLEFLTDSQL